MATTEMETVVEAQPREANGKNVARRLRKSGKVPAVVYGAGKPPLSVSVDPKQIARILHSEAGHNTIFDLQVDGERTKAMIVEWQYEPIKGSLLHLDLQRIAMDRRLKVQVPISLQGEAAGVKQQGGILDQVLREVEVECLPGDIPSHIDADVSDLVFGQSLRVSDLPLDRSKVKILTPADQVVAHVTSVKEEVAPAPEAVAADAAAAPAEPEVIKKGKQETAEEGAEAVAEKAEKPEKAEKKEKK
ncbi:MAG: 50S ribosomal protein L25 [Acidobacteriia bacterium]|nr:50S ribosomal protein L25 [Terriglobia bacterium]